MFCFLILSPYFLPFPHVLGTILLMWRLMKIFYFLSHFHTNVYVKLFIKELNLFCSLARPNISIFDPFVIEVWKCIQYRRAGSVFYGSVSIAMNMPIGIILKIDPSGLQQKCISGDFPQLLELPLLRMHIDGCFQSVREATVSGIFAKYIGKQIWRSSFKVKLCKNSKKIVSKTRFACLSCVWSKG